MSLFQLLGVLLATSIGVRADCSHASPGFACVDLGYASYQSNVHLDDGTTSFLGIRYAAPPTGKLRFGAPQAPAQVPGVQNATSQPPECFQMATGSAPGAHATSPFRSRDVDPGVTPTVNDDDCLFLNVHVPQNATSKSRLPVVFYIHGGGYAQGNVSAFPMQDLVEESQGGIVAVNIQYRLGLFGFLSGQKVKDGGSLNAGLLDQNFALQWAQEHIAKFGGDPTKVTLMGESAGAGSVLQHIVANGGNTEPPLFRAGVANSPFLPFQFNFDDATPEALYSEVVSQANCTSSSDTLACLRAVNATDLAVIDAAIANANFLGVYTFTPVVDGKVIVERPTVTLQRGRVNGEALIVSTNAHEGTLFAPPASITAANFTVEEYITQLFPKFDQAHVQQAAAVYSTGEFIGVPAQASAIMGDSIFVCPAYSMLAAFGQHAWKAEFAIPPGLHGEDLSYEFNHFSTPPTFNNTDFSTAFQQGFLNTIRALNPNDKFEPTITPNWPSWGLGHAEMLFNQTAEADSKPVVKAITTDPAQLARCAFWDSVAAINSQ
ncbi:alpha/beta-hydrolase [Dentipellis sp. KUC8613]|nr:alpha/beta-hydrolase [Dentipellis sp. KUC8613]